MFRLGSEAAGSMATPRMLGLEIALNHPIWHSASLVEDLSLVMGFHQHLFAIWQGDMQFFGGCFAL